MKTIEIPQQLRTNVNRLGTMLGETIAGAEGQDLLDKIEHIRGLAKTARTEQGTGYHVLAEFLNQLPNEELLPVARAFSQFLNLANIADQHQMISRDLDHAMSATQTLKNLFVEFASEGYSKQQILEELGLLKIDLVLTAHPTEITRRSLINKHVEIDNVLSQFELDGHTEREHTVLAARLCELIAQIWHTVDFREHRPTPVDEAKWGFAVIENSLWDAVPNFMRRLSSTSFEVTGERLPFDFSPLKFSFWMGGDRDGNPNVTSTVTREVLLLCRWRAADLYLQEVRVLMDELSMYRANETLGTMANGAREPYRAVLRELRDLLVDTLAYLESALKGIDDANAVILTDVDQLWVPLKACYDSLIEQGMESIANAKLRDLMWRVQSFGVHLVNLDIRQESDRHAEVFSELTRYLGMGDYAEWSEADKQSFLLKELQSKRPLIPNNWQPSDSVQEVLRTCREISLHARDGFGIYVISMARIPSDVLAVYLLQKESGVVDPLPVAPLFETLDDLNNSADIIKQLLQMPWYRGNCQGCQTVMIGYSDSAKDAGVLAAGWAQYMAQENLLGVCEEAGVSLTLFHGRGGTIGRGGAPAHAALLSQPPGSLRHGLRVTEQGEMIRAKLGLSAIAIKSLALYTSAILKANLDKPPVPSEEWRTVMHQLADISCNEYHNVVRHNESFIDYFRSATPQSELGNLPLGSRPARRNAGGGIEGLRAIPWIFSWSQNRLMLPAWLGAGAALQKVIDDGGQTMLEEMCQSWPFFSTRISMLEMVFAKADSAISEYYDSLLVDDSIKQIGINLRNQLKADIDTVLGISNDKSLMEDVPQTKASVEFRNTYVDPLNLLQAELLRRNRQQPDEVLEQAIMATIAGISAGLRNTG